MGVDVGSTNLVDLRCDVSLEAVLSGKGVMDLPVLHAGCTGEVEKRFLISSRATDSTATDCVPAWW